MTAPNSLTPHSSPRGPISRSISYQIGKPSPSSSLLCLHAHPLSHHHSASSAYPAASPSASHYLQSTSSPPSLLSTTRQRSCSVGTASQSYVPDRRNPGGDGDESSDGFPLSSLLMMGHEVDRGPGTPDFVLGARNTKSSTRSRQDKGKGRLEEIKMIDDGSDRSAPHYSRPVTAAASTDSRPRLTTRLRSFLTSFSGVPEYEQDAVSDEVPPDDRSSCSSIKLSSNSPRPRRTPSGNIVVTPLARPAGTASFGDSGLNDQSPPLTPNSSNDERLYSRSWDRASQYSPPGTDSTPTTSRADSPSPFGGAAMSLGHIGDVLAKPVTTMTTRAYGTPTFSQRLRTTSPRALAAEVGALLRAGLHSRTLRRNMPTLLMLLTTFVSATLVVFLLLTTLPLRMPTHGLTQLSLAEIRDVCLSLKEYTASTPRAYHHTLFVLCLFYTYKQAFNVPGSIISNVVFGALFGVWRATIWLSIFTAVGGSGAAVMSALIAPLVLKLPGMQKAVAMMRKALGSKNLNRSGVKVSATDLNAMRRRSHSASRNGTPRPPHRAQSPHPSHKSKAHHSTTNRPKGRGNLFSILLILRLLPFTPYGVMNIACGVLNVPLLPFGVTLAMGSVPWNAVTAQVGEILVEVVAAIPGESASSEYGEGRGTGASEATLAEQLDTGGFHNVDAPSSIGNSTSSANSHLLSSAAHKAGGGVKILLAKIWTREMMVKLIGLSLLSITPILLGKWWRAHQARRTRASRRARTHTVSSHDRRESQQLAEQTQMQSPSHFIQAPKPTSAYGDHYLHTPLAGPSTPSAAAVLDWSDGEDQDGYGDEEYATSCSEEDDFLDDYAYTGSADGDDDEEDGDEDGFITTSSTMSSSELTQSPLPKPKKQGHSIFSSAAATLAVETGPALIAQLTRSASRTGWNRSTAAWFGGGGAGGSSDGDRSRSPDKDDADAKVGRQAVGMLGESSVNSGLSPGDSDSIDGWSAAFTAHPTVIGSGHHNFTPQLEAQNPFDIHFQPQQQSNNQRRSLHQGIEQQSHRLSSKNSSSSGGESRRGSAQLHFEGDFGHGQREGKREPKRFTAVVR